MLHTPSLILLLVLSEGQSKAWEPSKKAMLFQILGEGASDRKVIVSFVPASEGELSRCKTPNSNVFYIKRNCFSYRRSVLWGSKVKVVAVGQECN
jgi:hypothetical protein